MSDSAKTFADLKKTCLATKLSGRTASAAALTTAVCVSCQSSCVFISCFYDLYARARPTVHSDVKYD